MTAASLPYEESSIIQLLALSSFLLALNLIQAILDKTLYCGLVGQVFIGIAWGTPGTQWLPEVLENAVVQLGYLGLILIVFGGGLSTKISTLRANLLFSICVALTGITAPIALSFLLGPLVGATYLQCFAAGAALCSTSLGTTFAVLSTSGLVATRLGSVLSAAAMMDDVVGLVMIQIVSDLGQGNDEISATVVLRPVLVSLAFAVMIPLVCRFVIRPFMIWWNRRLKCRRQKDSTLSSEWFGRRRFTLVIQTALLLSLIAGAGYARTSVLFAAYIAGAVGSWLEDELATLERPSANVPQQTSTTNGEDHQMIDAPTTDANTQTTATNTANLTPTDPEGQKLGVYECYYSQPVERILKPFFFASIGFSIPITNLFSGPVVWRGIIYSVLMMLGKFLCGLWLVRFPISSVTNRCKLVLRRSQGLMTRTRLQVQALLRRKSKAGTSGPSPSSTGTGVSIELRRQRPQAQAHTPRIKRAAAQPSSSLRRGSNRLPSKPLSLYPAAIISFAMIARGEIGFLISSVAESQGIFRSSSSSSSDGDGASEIFLIVTWAIVLCTILGPLCFGLLVRRVKKLEASSAVDGRREKNVLGAWGVS